MLYHGTCTAFEKSIKAYGLVGHPEYKFQQDNGSYYEPSLAEHNAVYLTPDKLIAIEFAQFRADWMRAKIGQVVMFNGVNGKKKLGGVIIPDCKPLLVTVASSVPLKEDENDEYNKLFWTDKAVPASKLKFTVLPDKPEYEFIDLGGLDGESLEDYQAEYIKSEFPGSKLFRP